MAGIAVIATACGGNSNSASSASSASPTGPEKPNLVVAVVPAEAQAGLYIAQAKGLFTRAGLHVTIKPVVSALTVIPALLHGDVDIAGGQYPSYIATQAKGLAQMRILAAGFALGPRVNEILAPATGSVHSLADLKGKTIAVNALNSEGADLIYSSLKRHGITPAQVHLVAMPFPAMLPALAAGKIAAAYETEPFVTLAAKRYGDRELADMSSGTTTDMPLTGYGTLASWVAKYPRTAAAFTKAVEQGNAIAASNHAVLAQVLASALHLSPKITGVMATGTFPTGVNPAQIQRVANLMLEYGQLKQPLNVKQMIEG